MPTQSISKQQPVCEWKVVMLCHVAIYLLIPSNTEHVGITFLTLAKHQTNAPLLKLEGCLWKGNSIMLKKVRYDSKHVRQAKALPSSQNPWCQKHKFWPAKRTRSLENPPQHHETKQPGCSSRFSIEVDITANTKNSTGGRKKKHGWQWYTQPFKPGIPQTNPTTPQLVSLLWVGSILSWFEDAAIKKSTPRASLCLTVCFKQC